MFSLREMQIELQKNMELLRLKDELIDDLEEDLIYKEAVIIKLRHDLSKAKTEFRRLVHKQQSKSETEILPDGNLYGTKQRLRLTRRTASSNVLSMVRIKSDNNLLNSKFKDCYPKNLLQRTSRSFDASS